MFKTAQNHYSDPAIFRLLGNLGTWDNSGKLASNNYSALAKEAGI